MEDKKISKASEYLINKVWYDYAIEGRVVSEDDCLKAIEIAKEELIEEFIEEMKNDIVEEKYVIDNYKDYYDGDVEYASTIYNTTNKWIDLLKSKLKGE